MVEVEASISMLDGVTRPRTELSSTATNISSFTSDAASRSQQENTWYSPFEMTFPRQKPRGNIDFFAVSKTPSYEVCEIHRKHRFDQVSYGISLKLYMTIPKGFPYRRIFDISHMFPCSKTSKHFMYPCSSEHDRSYVFQCKDM